MQVKDDAVVQIEVVVEKSELINGDVVKLLDEVWRWTPEVPNGASAVVPLPRCRGAPMRCRIGIVLMSADCCFLQRAGFWTTPTKQNGGTTWACQRRCRTTSST